MLCSKPSLMWPPSCRLWPHAHQAQTSVLLSRDRGRRRIGRRPLCLAIRSSRAPPRPPLRSSLLTPLSVRHPRAVSLCVPFNAFATSRTRLADRLPYGKRRQSVECFHCGAVRGLALCAPFGDGRAPRSFSGGPLGDPSSSGQPTPSACHLIYDLIGALLALERVKRWAVV